MNKFKVGDIVVLNDRAAEFYGENWVQRNKNIPYTITGLHPSLGCVYCPLPIGLVRADTITLAKDHFIKQFKQIYIKERKTHRSLACGM